jgi:hypothetical protein
MKEQSWITSVDCGIRGGSSPRFVRPARCHLGRAKRAIRRSPKSDRIPAAPSTNLRIMNIKNEGTKLDYLTRLRILPWFTSKVCQAYASASRPRQAGNSNVARTRSNPCSTCDQPHTMNTKMKEQSWISSPDCGIRGGSSPRFVRPARCHLGRAKRAIRRSPKSDRIPAASSTDDEYKNEGTKLDYLTRLRNPSWFTSPGLSGLRVGISAVPSGQLEYRPNPIESWKDVRRTCTS